MKRRYKVLIGLIALVAVAAAWGVRRDLPATEVDATYRTEQSRFVELADGTRMHYLEAGAASAPALVLVHGSFDSAFTWERVLPSLAESFHVIALDLPAHGLTGRTRRDRYTLADMVEALAGLVDRLGLARFSLGGNSMGGNTAWLYALAHPERVERLVLIDSGGYPTAGAPLVEAEPGPVMRWIYRHGNPTPLVRRGLERSVANPDVISDAYVTRMVDFLRREGTRDAQAVRNRARAIDDQPFARIPEITTPTLIVWGDRDELLPVEAARRFDADLPHSELRIYEGIGHMPQHEAPERLVTDIRAFLQ